MTVLMTRTLPAGAAASMLMMLAGCASTARPLMPAARDYFSKGGNIDLILYEGRPTDFFDHSYLSSNPQVSSDLIQLIRYRRAPGEPGRPLVPMGVDTWKFPQPASPLRADASPGSTTTLPVPPLSAGAELQPPPTAA
jgi:hypothetical protein